MRNKKLQAQLQLAHIRDGEEEIRQICAEYIDVFKLTSSYVCYSALCFNSLNSSKLSPYFAEFYETGQLLERG